jgi:chlorite dismutase
VLHLFYSVDLGVWQDFTEKERQIALADLKDLVEEARKEPQTQIVTLSMMARADLGFMIIAPNLHRLNALEKLISQVLGTGVLLKEFTYLSLTEKSEYTPQESDYAHELELKDGLKRGSEEFEAKMTAFRDRIQHYTHDRLYPVLPQWEYFCFYPMSKRRNVDQNWYALDHNKRKELMQGHMKVGRTYAGRVRQLITGSTGMDDWEWGVTLFSHDPAEIKAIVYQMRFDEVSHTYAEFGPFYNGLPLPLDEIYKRILLA